jgi:hypothetical protein
MPIHIRHRDTSSTSTHQADISRVMDYARLVSQASYTALAAAFWVLYGSIETMLDGVFILNTLFQRILINYKTNF